MITIKKYYRDMYIRLFKPRAYWHNRKFNPALDIIQETPTTYSIFWKRKRFAHATAASAIKEENRICNIIGSGPSINSIKNPRLLFANRTICVNGSIIISLRVKSRPDYYMVGDKGFIQRKFDFFKSAAVNCGKVVLDATGINAICNIDPSFLKKLNIVYYDDLKHPFNKCRLKKAQDRRGIKFEASLINHSCSNVAFCKDLSLGIFTSGTVLYGAIQFACGIGFRELRIFGMDLNASGRFYHEEVPEPTFLDESYESGIRPAFELVKQYAAESQLSIYNCSLQSRLPDQIVRKMDPNAILELISRHYSVRHGGEI